MVGGAAVPRLRPRVAIRLSLSLFHLPDFPVVFIEESPAFGLQAIPVEESTMERWLSARYLETVATGLA